MSKDNPSPRIDEVVDELLPEELDWRRLVRTYPIPAVALAAAGGFLLGRRHGRVLLSAAIAFATNEVTRNVSSLVDAGLGGGSRGDVN